MRESFLDLELPGMVYRIADVGRRAADAARILRERAQQRIIRYLGLTQPRRGVCNHPVEWIIHQSVEHRASQPEVTRVKSIAVFHAAAEVKVRALAAGVVDFQHDVAR